MTFKLTIDHIGAAGDGIGYLDQQTFYVPQSAPADVLHATSGAKRGVGFDAVLDDIITTGPDRQKPVCRHYDQCGGCTLQHLTDAFVAHWKRDLVITQLDRVGIAGDVVKDTITSPQNSRRRVDFIASRRKKSAMLGFHQRRSKQIFDIGDCPVLHPVLLTLVKPLRDLASRILPRNTKANIIASLTDGGADILFKPEKNIELDLNLRQILSDFANEQDLARISWQSTDKGLLEVVSARRTPTLKMGNVAVMIPPAGFLQATQEGETSLTAIAGGYLGGCKSVVDLFSGCGSFTFPLALHSKVHAVDSNPDLIDALQSSANRAVKPVSSESRDLFQRPLTSEELKHFDGLLFDPPRAGAKSQIDEIAVGNIPCVVAVSCNPASFAQDAKKLTDGGYVLREVTPVDQFRWSAHVELIALFIK